MKQNILLKCILIPLLSSHMPLPYFIFSLAHSTTIFLTCLFIVLFCPLKCKFPKGKKKICLFCLLLYLFSCKSFHFYMVKFNNIFLIGLFPSFKKDFPTIQYSIFKKRYYRVLMLILQSI